MSRPSSAQSARLASVRRLLDGWTPPKPGTVQTVQSLQRPVRRPWPFMVKEAQ